MVRAVCSGESVTTTSGSASSSLSLRLRSTLRSSPLMVSAGLRSSSSSCTSVISSWSGTWKARVLRGGGETSVSSSSFLMFFTWPWLSLNSHRLLGGRSRWIRCHWTGMSPEL